MRSRLSTRGQSRLVGCGGHSHVDDPVSEAGEGPAREVGGDPQHRDVAGQDLADQFADALGLGPMGEVLEQECADTPTVLLIVHEDGELGPRLDIGGPLPGCHPDHGPGPLGEDGGVPR